MVKFQVAQFRLGGWLAFTLLLLATPLASAGTAGRVAIFYDGPDLAPAAPNLFRIKLPARSKNCVDSYSPKLGSDWSIYRCAYGLTIIDKVMESGMPVLSLDVPGDERYPPAVQAKDRP